MRVRADEPQLRSGNVKVRNVSLEMSLKPFGDPSPDHRDHVLRHLFRRWDALTRHADRVSVLLWAADGSEILDYAGRLEETFEWCQWLGTPRPKHGWSKEADPERISIHSRTYSYMANPPAMTYGWLRDLCTDIKRIGSEVTGLPVRVGATFDPGPEFAISSFKYERHPEISTGGTMGAGSMVCCYGKLHTDDRRYAGFPDGIPEGTTVGTFLGHQSRCFMGDLGFDYLWLSNGFGFGLETWGVKGTVYRAGVPGTGCGGARRQRGGPLGTTLLPPELGSAPWTRVLAGRYPLPPLRRTHAPDRRAHRSRFDPHLPDRRRAAGRGASYLPRTPSAPRGAGVRRLSWSPLSSSSHLDAVARRRGRAVPEA